MLGPVIEWLRAYPDINCSCGSTNPLAELLSPIAPKSRQQLAYENAKNAEAFRQLLRKQSSEPRTAKRGRRSRALSLLWGVQHRKMFLDWVCDQSPGTWPSSWDQYRCSQGSQRAEAQQNTLTGALPLESTHFPVKMKVSRKLHLWFPRDFSLSLCFGSLRPLWYLSKAFPLAHLILITVYGNGNSVPPQGSNFERREGKQVQYDCLGEGHAVEYFNHFSVLWLWLFHADQQH